MNRREMLLSIGGGIAASMLSAPAWASESSTPKKTKLGVDDFSYNIRSRAEKAGYTPRITQDPLTFLKYCHSIGAGGLQCAIGKRDQAYTKELRAYVEDNNLFIEDSVGLGGKVDTERFEAALQYGDQYLNGSPSATGRSLAQLYRGHALVAAGVCVCLPDGDRPLPAVQPGSCLISGSRKVWVV